MVTMQFVQRHNFLKYGGIMRSRHCLGVLF